MCNLCALLAAKAFSASAAARISSALRAVRMGAYGVLYLRNEYPMRENQTQIIARVRHAEVRILPFAESVMIGN